MSNDRFQFVRAVLRNALLWGALIGVVMGSLVTGWVLIFPGPGVESLPERIGEALFAGIGMGLRFAIGGAAIGTFFAVALRFAFRGRRLADLSLPKFALLGAVVGGVGIPLFYQALNVLSDGHMIAWNLVLDDSIWASVFGATAAAGTIFVARRAKTLPQEREVEQLGAGETFGAVAQGKVSEAAVARRSEV